MGWTESPPYLFASTEIVTDVANWKSPLPHHLGAIAGSLPLEEEPATNDICAISGPNSLHQDPNTSRTTNSASVSSLEMV
jgi:hypothetical protein